jgi:4'-phosphopantetheinyl transferase
MGKPLVDCCTIHLWRGVIAATEASYQKYWQLLGQAEQHHAIGINNEQLHKRYVAIHAQLRIVLADALNTAPEQLCIHKTVHGKPYLVDYPGFAFNLSHTANKMVVAYAYHYELGVDIEQCKPRLNLAALVNKCFAEAEQTYWQQLPPAQQTQAFYQFWVRKEAFVKATGRGIALGLDQCVVNPDNWGEFLKIPDSYGEASAWSIEQIEVGEGFCGALVTRTKGH